MNIQLCGYQKYKGSYPTPDKLITMMEIEEDITPSRFRRRRKLICLALAFLITIAFEIYICIIVSAGSRKVSYQNCTSKDLDGATVSICESVVDIQFKKEQFEN